MTRQVQLNWWKVSGVVLLLVGGYSAIVTVASAWHSPLTLRVFILCAVGYAGFFAIMAVAAVVFNGVASSWREPLPPLSPAEAEQTSEFMARAGDHKVAQGTPLAVAISAYAIQLNAAERFRSLAADNMLVRMQKFIDNVQTETEFSPATLENLSTIFYELCSDLLFLQTNDAACCLLTENARDAERWQTVRATVEQVRKRLAAAYKKHFQPLLKKSRQGANLQARVVKAGIGEVAGSVEESLEQWTAMLDVVKELVQSARERTLAATRWQN